jgi:hypothetical protein
MRCRSDATRRRFAVQLCTLRTHGRFLPEAIPAPVTITNYVARQLDLPLVLFGEVPERLATETEHLQRIRTYLGWRPFDDEARARLTRWLTQRATDDLLPRDLVVRAEEILRTWHVVLPVLSTLEELVASVSTCVQHSYTDQLFGLYHLLGSGGPARTDSPHVLAAIRACNRLACVGETLRAALNDLAVVAPDWLRQQITVDWFERYSKRCEESRLPQGEAKRYAYAEQIGRDGLQLLHALYHATAPRWIRDIPIVEILRQTWVYQYDTDEQGHLRWRTAQNLPPAGMRMDSPYDPDAHYGNKRSITWTGYKVHMTETCDDDTLHVITHVETPEAAVTDVTMTEPIYQALVAKQLPPETHIVDAGYVDATLLVESPREFHMALIGPVRPDISWYTKNEQAYDISQFHINWEARQVPCPRGKIRSAWSTRQDRWQNPVISVKF